MKNFISKLIRKSKAPQKSGPVLILRYEKVEIGRLWYEGGLYHFAYSKDFGTSGLKPITDFPEVTKEYRSPSLFPYFEVRLPSAKRSDLSVQLDRTRRDGASELEVLAKFGKNAASDPYVLESAS
jgi:hypothetical protein